MSRWMMPASWAAARAAATCTAISTQLPTGSGPFPSDLAQRPPDHELGGEVVVPVRLADLVDRQDARMVERRCRLRLADETGHPLVVVGELRRQDLERDLTVETPVLGSEDLTHPALADGRDDGVLPDRRAAGEAHSAVLFLMYKNTTPVVFLFRSQIRSSNDRCTPAEPLRNREHPPSQPHEIRPNVGLPPPMSRRGVKKPCARESTP